jgi:transcriptional repressor
METTANRLNKALKLRGMKPTELHEKTGIGKSSISQYMSGLVKPKQDRIYLMAVALNVNELWLMGYDSPMKRQVNSSLLLSSEEQSLIEKYRSIDDADRTLVDNIINDLHGRHLSKSNTKSHKTMNS